MEPECWEWAYAITAQNQHLSDEELHNLMHGMIERRILKRFLAYGII